VDLRAWQIGIDPGDFGQRWAPVLTFAVLVQLAMISVGVYGPDSLRSMRYATARLLVASALASLLFRSSISSCPTHPVAVEPALRDVPLDGPPGPGAGTVRRIAGYIGLSASGAGSGRGHRADRLRKLGERPEAGFVIVGYVGMSAQPPEIEEAIHRDAISNLTRHVENLGVSEVVLALEERRNALPLKDLLRIKTTGVFVTEFSTFSNARRARRSRHVNPSWLIFRRIFLGRMVSSAIKRLFDIVASMTLLVVTAPIIAIFAVLVKLDSRGPAFFRQTRVGHYGETFR
jgi:hypothetical protein